MEKLFTFLDSPKPLNLTRAGYFARVVSCLLMKRGSEVLAFLEGRRSIIDKLLEHIDTTSTAEVCLAAIQCCLQLNAETETAWLTAIYSGHLGYKEEGSIQSAEECWCAGALLSSWCR